jgi:hypothetical protein
VSSPIHRRPLLPHAPQKGPSVSLRIHHAREEERQLESEKLAAEFASLSGKLNTVTDINHVLGKVFTALAEKRISHQIAETFGYLGQLLLQSIPGVKNELNAAVQHPGAYDAMLRHNIPFFRRFRKP